MFAPLAEVTATTGTIAQMMNKLSESIHDAPQPSPPPKLVAALWGGARARAGAAAAASVVAGSLVKGTDPATSNGRGAAARSGGKKRRRFERKRREQIDPAATAIVVPMTAERPPENTIAGTAVVSEAGAGTLAHDVLSSDAGMPTAQLWFVEGSDSAAAGGWGSQDGAAGGRPVAERPPSQGSRGAGGEDCSDSEWQVVRRRSGRGADGGGAGWRGTDRGAEAPPLLRIGGQGAEPLAPPRGSSSATGRRGDRFGRWDDDAEYEDAWGSGRQSLDVVRSMGDPRVSRQLGGIELPSTILESQTNGTVAKTPGAAGSASHGRKDLTADLADARVARNSGTESRAEQPLPLCGPASATPTEAAQGPLPSLSGIVAGLGTTGGVAALRRASATASAESGGVERRPSQWRQGGPSVADVIRQSQEAPMPVTGTPAADRPGGIRKRDSDSALARRAEMSSGLDDLPLPRPALPGMPAGSRARRGAPARSHSSGALPSPWAAPVLADPVPIRHNEVASISAAVPENGRGTSSMLMGGETLMIDSSQRGEDVYGDGEDEDVEEEEKGASGLAAPLGGSVAISPAVPPKTPPRCTTSSKERSWRPSSPGASSYSEVAATPPGGDRSKTCSPGAGAAAPAVTPTGSHSSSSSSSASRPHGASLLMRSRQAPTCAPSGDRKSGSAATELFPALPDCIASGSPRSERQRCEVPSAAVAAPPASAETVAGPRARADSGRARAPKGQAARRHRMRKGSGCRSRTRPRTCPAGSDDDEDGNSSDSDDEDGGIPPAIAGRPVLKLTQTVPMHWPDDLDATILWGGQVNQDDERRELLREADWRVLEGGGASGISYTADTAQTSASKPPLWADVDKCVPFPTVRAGVAVSALSGVSPGQPLGIAAGMLVASPGRTSPGGDAVDDLLAMGAAPGGVMRMAEQARASFLRRGAAAPAVLAAGGGHGGLVAPRYLGSSSPPPLTQPSVVSPQHLHAAPAMTGSDAARATTTPPLGSRPGGDGGRSPSNSDLVVPTALSPDALQLPDAGGDGFDDAASLLLHVGVHQLHLGGWESRKSPSKHRRKRRHRHSVDVAGIPSSRLHRVLREHPRHATPGSSVTRPRGPRGGTDRGAGGAGASFDDGCAPPTAASGIFPSWAMQPSRYNPLQPLAGGESGDPPSDLFFRQKIAQRLRMGSSNSAGSSHRGPRSRGAVAAPPFGATPAPEAVSNTAGSASAGSVQSQRGHHAGSASPEHSPSRPEPGWGDSTPASGRIPMPLTGTTARSLAVRGISPGSGFGRTSSGGSSAASAHQAVLRAAQQPAFSPELGPSGSLASALSAENGLGSLALTPTSLKGSPIGLSSSISRLGSRPFSKPLRRSAGSADSALGSTVPSALRFDHGDRTASGGSTHESAGSSQTGSASQTPPRPSSLRSKQDTRGDIAHRGPGHGPLLRSASWDDAAADGFSAVSAVFSAAAAAAATAVAEPSSASPPRPTAQSPSGGLSAGGAAAAGGGITSSGAGSRSSALGLHLMGDGRASPTMITAHEWQQWGKPAGDDAVEGRGDLVRSPAPPPPLHAVQDSSLAVAPSNSRRSRGSSGTDSHGNSPAPPSPPLLRGGGRATTVAGISRGVVVLGRGQLEDAPLSPVPAAGEGGGAQLRRSSATRTSPNGSGAGSKHSTSHGSTDGRRSRGSGSSSAGRSASVGAHSPQSRFDGDGSGGSGELLRAACGPRGLDHEDDGGVESVASSATDSCAGSVLTEGLLQGVGGASLGSGGAAASRAGQDGAAAEDPHHARLAALVDSVSAVLYPQLAGQCLESPHYASIAAAIRTFLLHELDAVAMLPWAVSTYAIADGSEVRSSGVQWGSGNTRGASDEEALPQAEHTSAGASPSCGDNNDAEPCDPVVGEGSSTSSEECGHSTGAESCGGGVPPATADRKRVASRRAGTPTASGGVSSPDRPNTLDRASPSSADGGEGNSDASGTLSAGSACRVSGPAEVGSCKGEGGAVAASAGGWSVASVGSTSSSTASDALSNDASPSIRPTDAALRRGSASMQHGSAALNPALPETTVAATASSSPFASTTPLATSRNGAATCIVFSPLLTNSKGTATASKAVFDKSAGVIDTSSPFASPTGVVGPLTPRMRNSLSGAHLPSGASSESDGSSGVSDAEDVQLIRSRRRRTRGCSFHSRGSVSDDAAFSPLDSTRDDGVLLSLNGFEMAFGSVGDNSKPSPGLADALPKPSSPGEVATSSSSPRSIVPGLASGVPQGHPSTPEASAASDMVAARALAEGLGRSLGFAPEALTAAATGADTPPVAASDPFADPATALVASVAIHVRSGPQPAPVMGLAFSPVHSLQDGGIAAREAATPRLPGAEDGAGPRYLAASLLPPAGVDPFADPVTACDGAVIAPNDSRGFGASGLAPSAVPSHHGSGPFAAVGETSLPAKRGHGHAVNDHWDGGDEEDDDEDDDGSSSMSSSNVVHTGASVAGAVPGLEDDCARRAHLGPLASDDAADFSAASQADEFGAVASGGDAVASDAAMSDTPTPPQASSSSFLAPTRRFWEHFCRRMLPKWTWALLEDQPGVAALRRGALEGAIRNLRMSRWWISRSLAETAYDHLDTFLRHYKRTRHGGVAALSPERVRVSGGRVTVGTHFTEDASCLVALMSTHVEVVAAEHSTLTGELAPGHADWVAGQAEMLTRTAISLARTRPILDAHFGALATSMARLISCRPATGVTVLRRLLGSWPRRDCSREVPWLRITQTALMATPPPMVNGSTVWRPLFTQLVRCMGSEHQEVASCAIDVLTGNMSALLSIISDAKMRELCQKTLADNEEHWSEMVRTKSEFLFDAILDLQ